MVIVFLLFAVDHPRGINELQEVSLVLVATPRERSRDQFSPILWIEEVVGFWFGAVPYLMWTCG